MLLLVKMREKGQISIWRKILKKYCFSLILIYGVFPLQRKMVFALCTYFMQYFRTQLLQLLNNLVNNSKTVVNLSGVTFTPSDLELSRLLCIKAEL